MSRVKRLWSHALAFLAGASVATALIWSVQHAPARLQARLADDRGPLAADATAPDLPSRTLMLPVKGMDLEDLQESFEDKRGAGRRHEAIDILAPRNTPVLAIEDGTIAKLFTSKAGGLTVYQFDPTSRYAYYYAHLERYAAGLSDGVRVRRGQVLGYVGTSGNAPPNTPHLHFAIYRLDDKKRWWQGTPIDPFMVLQNGVLEGK